MRKEILILTAVAVAGLVIILAVISSTGKLKDIPAPSIGSPSGGVSPSNHGTGADNLGTALTSSSVGSPNGKTPRTPEVVDPPTAQDAAKTWRGEPAPLVTEQVKRILEQDGGTVEDYYDEQYYSRHEAEQLSSSLFAMYERQIVDSGLAKQPEEIYKQLIQPRLASSSIAPDARRRSVDQISTFVSEATEQYSSELRKHHLDTQGASKDMRSRADRLKNRIEMYAALDGFLGQRLQILDSSLASELGPLSIGQHYLLR